MSRVSYLIAGALVVGVAGWLASGMATDEADPPIAERRAEPLAPLVEVTLSQARDVGRYVMARGDVRAFRNAAARTQTSGRVAEIFVDQGERVEEGDPLVRLSVEGRDSRLREARALLDQRQQDYEAAAQLLGGGYTTAARVRELETQLQAARESVQRLEEEIADTTVTAPYGGIVDSIAVETGEFVDAGTGIVTVIDNTPLRTVVRVNQQDVARVEVGRIAAVTFATGHIEAGRVCFVSAAADPQTRTFRVEVRSLNANGAIPSGISAEVRVPTDEVEAHFVSPAILALGTDGALGVKSVEEGDAVAFNPVSVVRAQSDGVWVSGLEPELRIITAGQGFVQAGDTVRVSQREPDEPSVEPAGPVGEAQAGSNAPPEEICSREPAADRPTFERLTGHTIDPADETGALP